MLNSSEINQTLERIKATPSKNDKVDMLREYLEDENFRWAIVQALDPRIRFGVAQKTIDEVERLWSHDPGSDCEFWSDSVPIDVRICLEGMSAGVITGNAARERLELCRRVLTPDSWHLLKRILLKHPDAGFTDSSVNKARPNTIWTFDCMLAHPFEEDRVKNWPVAVEPKIDGVRCLITVQTIAGNTNIGFFSRTGKEFTTFDHLKPQIEEAMSGIGWFTSDTMVIDCEIDSGDFLATVSQARKKEGEAKDAVARIFDLLTQDEWEGDLHRPYTQRRKTIIEVFGSPDEPKFDRLVPVPLKLATNVEDVVRINSEYQAKGLEGVIVKPLDHIYERKRSYSWMKIKGFETHDLIITGFFEGTGKYQGAMGGVICDFNGVEVRVGGGWTDADRTYIWSHQSEFLGRMIEVGAHETTPDGSLRHPRFMRFRDDKHEAA